MKPKTRENRVRQRIDRQRGDVFLRADFDDLGGYDQVGRILRQLVRDGKLIRIGQGVYARAVKCPLSDRLVPPKGLGTLIEALHRLGIETAPSRLEEDAGAAERGATGAARAGKDPQAALSGRAGDRRAVSAEAAVIPIRLYEWQPIVVQIIAAV